MLHCLIASALFCFLYLITCDLLPTIKSLYGVMSIIAITTMLCVVSLQAEESCIFDECVADIATEESRLEVMLWEISGKIE